MVIRGFYNKTFIFCSSRNLKGHTLKLYSNLEGKILKLFIVPLKMTNNRPIHRLNYQWQASIHFNWPMVGQYDIIFIGTIKCFFATYGCCYSSNITFLTQKRPFFKQMLTFLGPYLNCVGRCPFILFVYLFFKKNC